MPPRRIQRLLALLGAALGLWACRNAAPPRVFVLDDGVKMSADGRLLVLGGLKRYLERNPAWDGREIALAGARGETVAFQVMVQPGARALEGVTVSASDLRREGGGDLSADRFSRFREWYVAVTVPSASPAGSAGKGEYPDALVPADTPGFGLPVAVPAGRTQGIWIDCAIPASAAAGTYRGALVVSAAGAEVARFAVRLEVHGFAMPAERHLPWRIGYSGWELVPERLGIAEGSDAWLDLERELYRLVWDGHLAVPTTHYHDLRDVVPARGSGAALRIDWARFDRRFGGYLDGSAFESERRVNVFSLPVNLHRGWPFRLGADPAKVDAATLAAASRQVARHWDEKGWRLADAFVYVADEPGRDRLAAVRKACAALHEGDPRIRTSVALYTELGRDARGLVKELAGFVDRWELAGDYADVPALRERQAAGDRVGFYQGGEPYQGGEALDDDGLALTTWPWIAWRYGLDSLFLYNMTEWDYARLARAQVPWAKGKREIWENPLNQSWATNSQGVLLYPGSYVGRRGVVASMRLKQVRRGLQDYEYLWLARRGGDGALADAIASRLVPRALHEAGPPGKVGKGRGAWERDPRAWAAARLELARAIDAKPSQGFAAPPSGNPTRSLPSTRDPRDGTGGMRRALE